MRMRSAAAADTPAHTKTPTRSRRTTAARKQQQLTDNEADEQQPASPLSPQRQRQQQTFASPPKERAAMGSSHKGRRGSSGGGTRSKGASSSGGGGRGRGSSSAGGVATKAPGGWAGQHPLRIESPAAFWVIAIGPLFVWWLAVFSGIQAYNGLPGGRKIRHPLLWFDKGFVRPFGALLPFVILAARLAINAAADAFSGDAAAAAAAAARRRRGRGQLGTLAWSCGWLYGLIALARILLYCSHYYAMRGSLFAEHLVSDHLFLGGTIMICLQAEAACLLSDALRGLEARVTAREAGLTVAFVAALFLYLCTAADMYYTARFYHYPLESFVTTVAVFVLFQAPVVRWLHNSWRRSPPAVAAGSGAGASAQLPVLAVAQ